MISGRIRLECKLFTNRHVFSSVNITIDYINILSLYALLFSYLNEMNCIISNLLCFKQLFCHNCQTFHGNVGWSSLRTQWIICGFKHILWILVKGFKEAVQKIKKVIFSSLSMAQPLNNHFFAASLLLNSRKVYIK